MQIESRLYVLYKYINKLIFSKSYLKWYEKDTKLYSLNFSELYLKVGNKMCFK